MLPKQATEHLFLTPARNIKRLDVNSHHFKVEIDLKGNGKSRCVCMIAKKLITLVTAMYKQSWATIRNMKAQRRLERDALNIINNRLGTNYKSLKEVPSGTQRTARIQKS